MVMNRRFPEDGPEPAEDYEAADYARNASLDVLVREGKYNDVKEIISRHGDTMQDLAHGDPMEILIAEEAEEELRRWEEKRNAK